MKAALPSFDAVKTQGLTGPAPLLFLCEHASARFPPELGHLGLDEAARKSHVAWDPGALELACRLAGSFRSPLVHGSVSRLFYDCNRPPEADDAIPAKSERFDIPGNAGLTKTQREARCAAIYRPFCNAVDVAIAAARPKAIVTVHSFTPVFCGQTRDVEIGILSDSDSRLADAMIARDWQHFDVRRNEPYGPQDGVTHSLRRHAISRGLLNAMIEVRSDLLGSANDIDALAALFGRNLGAALSATGFTAEETS